LDNINLIIEIWDYWVEDRIDRGFKPMKLFILMKVGNKLFLKESYMED